jgi:asparagine synthase (glutamine-hydrolysing)
VGRGARTLFLARDRFGVKPLFYVERGDHFAFGSEIKTLVGEHGIPFEPDGSSVVTYVAYGKQPHAQSGDTFVAGVRSLPPGWWMRVTPQRVERGRYYDLRERARAAEALPDESTRVAEYGELLADAVRLRMRADVPLGTCLSGGLDSSSIVAIVNRALRADDDAGAVGDRQRTFSAVYEETARYNERRHIDVMVAATERRRTSSCPRPNGWHARSTRWCGRRTSPSARRASSRSGA